MIHITLLHSCIATPKFLKGVNNLTKYGPLSESLSFINTCPFLTIVKLVWKLRTIAVTESDLLQKVIRYRERVCFLCWMHAGIGRGSAHCPVLRHVGGAVSAMGAMAGGSWEPGRWQGPAWHVPQAPPQTRRICHPSPVGGPQAHVSPQSAELLHNFSLILFFENVSIT